MKIKEIIAFPFELPGGVSGTPGGTAVSGPEG